MNGEYFDHIASAEFQKERTEEIPSVTLYDLAKQDDRQALGSAIKRSPGNQRILPWSFSGERALRRAHKRDIFINDFRRHLIDEAKLDHPPGYFREHSEELEEYLRSNDTAENSVVAEYSWKQEGRFVRLPHEEDFHRIVTSRESLIIPDDVQEKLRNTKIAIAGMGVGASIGYLLVQSGAQRMTVADGGVIDLHDLNRYPQADVEHVGENHAINFTKIAYEANPFLRIDCYPQNVGTDGSELVPINQLLHDADIVIEEVDTLPMKHRIREVAKDAKIPVVMGTDIGRSAVIQFEYPETESFLGRLSPEQQAMVEDQSLSFEDTTELAIAMIGEDNIPDDLLRRASRQGLPFWPQDGGAARKSAAGVRDAIVDYLAGDIVPEEKVIL